MTAQKPRYVLEVEGRSHWITYPAAAIRMLEDRLHPRSVGDLLGKFIDALAGIGVERLENIEDEKQALELLDEGALGRMFVSFSMTEIHALLWAGLEGGRIKGLNTTTEYDAGRVDAILDEIGMMKVAIVAYMALFGAIGPQKEQSPDSGAGDAAPLAGTKPSPEPSVSG